MECHPKCCKKIQRKQTVSRDEFGAFGGAGWGSLTADRGGWGWERPLSFS